jgi:hypothetical protein
MDTDAVPIYSHSVPAIVHHPVSLSSVSLKWRHNECIQVDQLIGQCPHLCSLHSLLIHGQGGSFSLMENVQEYKTMYYSNALFQQFVNILLPKVNVVPSMHAFDQIIIEMDDLIKVIHLFRLRKKRLTSLHLRTTLGFDWCLEYYIIAGSMRITCWSNERISELLVRCYNRCLPDSHSALLGREVELLTYEHDIWIKRTLKQLNVWYKYRRREDDALRAEVIQWCSSRIQDMDIRRRCISMSVFLLGLY